MVLEQWNARRLLVLMVMECEKIVGPRVTEREKIVGPRAMECEKIEGPWGHGMREDCLS